MKEHEAVAFATRLKQIWLSGEDADSVIEWRERAGKYAFVGRVGVDVHLFAEEVGSREGVPVCRFTLGWKHEGVWVIRLMCAPSTGEVVSARAREGGVSQAVAEQFENRWRPFFRRGCWLCGLPVAASAEEHEAWSLKR